MTLVSFQSFGQSETEDYILQVNVDHVKHDRGKLFIAIYNNDEDWLKQEVTGAIVSIKDGYSEAILRGLPAGKYAVSLFHDENDNGKMDTNWIGIPKEPYACSRGARGRFGPPKWTDAVFEIAEDQQVIKISMK